MAHLLGFRIKNYRSLADVRVGQTYQTDSKSPPLPPLSAFIGRNGCGKSTLLDAFGFIADALANGVEAACDAPLRGGFARLRTQQAKGPIEFELFFEHDEHKWPMIYELKVDEANGVPRVFSESLRERRAKEVKGKPYYFLKLSKGRGKVWAGKSAEGDRASDQKVALADLNRLGITQLENNLKLHPRIVRFREYVAQWYLSYFVPDAARALPAVGAQRLLDRTGSNIGNVLQYFQRSTERETEFQEILHEITRAIPGLKKITAAESIDGRLLLKFDESGYEDPFFQQSMSDGTLKMLAYAILLADPSPRPFVGIEEPENGLYVELVEHLARRLKTKAEESALTQLLVTTHSPYFVDALQPDQVWLMQKVKGRTTVTRVSDIPGANELVEQGIPLGSVWYSNHLQVPDAT